MRAIIGVSWIDTTTASEWMGMAEALAGSAPKHILTVGVLVEERPDSVILAHTWAEDDDVTEVTCIPRGVIQKVEWYGEAEFAAAGEHVPTSMEVEQLESK